MDCSLCVSTSFSYLVFDSLCRTRTEGAELYRTLGVTPDADYMEVLEACDRLKEKYAADRKQVTELTIDASWDIQYV